MRDGKLDNNGGLVQKNSWRSILRGILPFYVVAHCAHHLLNALLTPLSTFIRDDFNLTIPQTGWMMSAFRLSYGIAQLPAGWLADRIGRKKLIIIGICGVAVAGFLVGISPGYLFLVAMLILMGIAGGGYHPSASPLVSNSVSPEMRGRALGLHMVGGSSSFFLAPLIGATIASLWGWRASYLVLTVPTIIFGVLFFFILRRRAPEAHITNPKEATPLTGDYTAGSSNLRIGGFIAFNTFIHATTMGIVGFIPVYLVDHFGVSNQTAGNLLAIVYSAGLWASILGGYLSDRFGRIPIILFTCLLAGPAIYLLNIVPYGYGFSIGAALMLIGMTNSMRAPVSEAYLISNINPKRRSTILGIYYFGNMEGSGVMMPLIGYLIEYYGYQSSFSFLAAAMIVVAIAFSLVFWRKRS